MIIPLAGHDNLVGTIDDKLFFLASTPSRVWDVAANPDVPDAVQGNRFSSPGYVDNLTALLPTASPKFAEVEPA